MVVVVAKKILSVKCASSFNESVERAGKNPAEASLEETITSLNLPYNVMSKRFFRRHTILKLNRLPNLEGAQAHWQRPLPLQSSGTFITLRTSFLFRLCEVSFRKGEIWGKAESK